MPRANTGKFILSEAEEHEWESYLPDKADEVDIDPAANRGLMEDMASDKDDKVKDDTVQKARTVRFCEETAETTR